MNTFQLTCFLTLSETLSFARTAEQLNITQPAVTHQIRSLETELNVKLFRRTTRIVEITPEGNLFINDARNILALTARAKNRFSDPNLQEIQAFSIGCHSYTQLFLLPNILQQLAAVHPNVHPVLRTVAFPYLYRLLEEEDVDIIIGFREGDGRRSPGSYLELMKIPAICICSKSSSLATAPFVTPEDLAKERLILSTPTMAPMAVARLQGLLIGGSRSPSDFYFCESAEAAMVLVQAGFGVSVLPDLFIPPDTPIARIPVEGAEPLSFGLYYKTPVKNPILKSFIRIMKSAVKDQADGGKNPLHALLPGGKTTAGTPDRLSP